MPLPLPNLDDRSFEQLVEEARREVIRSGVDWTDLSPGDPGMVLLELFAYLTETMIYRLNRLPDKAYVAFLRLLGVKLYPPAAASVTLRFNRARSGDRTVNIPRGRRVTLNRTDSKSEPPVFITANDAVIAPGEKSVDVLAYHADWIDAELVGKGTGLPGLALTVRRPPIVAELDLTVAVEAAAGELDERAPALQYDGRPFRIWREVENFTNLGPDPYVYVVDRMDGTIIFAPAARMQNPDNTLEDVPQALAAIPPNGREIRVWYKRGGGPEGNVAPEMLTVLKDPIAGVQVTNPGAATGGRAAETLDNARLRGPQELHSLQRAVTAQDFELIALYSSRAVARAKAFTRAALWTYAAPGTVEVLLVPYLPEDERGSQVTADALHQRETEEARSQIQAALDERRPLGTTCLVNWARYKTVKVTARIVVRPEEDRAAVQQRVVERLYQTINPLPTRYSHSGWPFGQALRASHVYDIALAEPSVRWVDQVRLLVSDVPDAGVRTIAADQSQPQTWYVGAGSTLFRSLNDGESFESINAFPDETVEVIQAHPDRPGFLAVVTSMPSGTESRVYISQNCGETWEFTPYTLGFVARDIAWVPRKNQPVLLLASDVGLFELIALPGGGLNQIVVKTDDQDLGFYAVTASTYGADGVNVAVAAQKSSGVFLSSDGGATRTFRDIGLRGEDIRELAVQVIGTRSFLWAGAAATGGEDGKGCFRWELRGSDDDPLKFQPVSKGWKGGSCRGLAFHGSWVFAASHRGGVLRLDTSASSPEWIMPDINCGLPLRDAGRFHIVDTVASDSQARLLMAGGIVGVFRSSDEGEHYASVSQREFVERVTLPQTWLFICDTPEIKVVSEDEAN